MPPAPQHAGETRTSCQRPRVAPASAPSGDNTNSDNTSRTGNSSTEYANTVCWCGNHSSRFCPSAAQAGVCHNANALLMDASTDGCISTDTTISSTVLPPAAMGTPSREHPPGVPVPVCWSKVPASWKARRRAPGHLGGLRTLRTTALTVSQSVSLYTQSTEGPAQWGKEAMVVWGDLESV